MNQEQKFLSVLESNKGILYKVAKSYVRDDEDRKDLIQEIVIQLWKSFGNYNEQYKYSTWFYRIALNVAISYFRKERSRKTISNPFSEALLHFEDDSVPEDKAHQLNALHQFLSELKALDRALMLLYLDEKNYKEMAEIMGISETNVATKIGRIKLDLKRKFLIQHS